MKKETYKKKLDALTDQYVHWAEIRNQAMKELQKIIKKHHKLEDKFYEEHPEEFEEEDDIY